MNTANLQLEGLLLTLVSLAEALRDKGLLDEAEILRALDRAERAATADPKRPDGLSAANVDAILFPARFLKLALAYRGERPATFMEIAGAVGQSKPAHGSSSNPTRTS